MFFISLSQLAPAAINYFVNFNVKQIAMFDTLHLFLLSRMSQF